LYQSVIRENVYNFFFLLFLFYFWLFCVLKNIINVFIIITYCNCSIG
jgi:hypothetical protein